MKEWRSCCWRCRFSHAGCSGGEGRLAIRAFMVVDLPLERYVAAVLAGESSIFQSNEALKAMAVAARTYAVECAAGTPPKASISATQRIASGWIWTVSRPPEAAVSETAGELLWFQGKPAFTPYTRDCGGRTEDASACGPISRRPISRATDPYCARPASPPGNGRPIPSGSQALLDSAFVRRRSGSHRHPESHCRPGRLRCWFFRRWRIGAHQRRLLPLRDGTRVGMEHSAQRSLRCSQPRSAGSCLRAPARARRGIMPARRRANGRGRPLLSRYSGVLLSGHAVGLTAAGFLAAVERRFDDDVDHAAGAGSSRARQRGAIERGFLSAPTGPCRRISKSASIPDLDTFRNATGEPGWVAAIPRAHASICSRRVLAHPRRAGFNPGARIRARFIDSQASPGSCRSGSGRGSRNFFSAAGGTGRLAFPEADLRQTADPAAPGGLTRMPQAESGTGEALRRDRPCWVG